ncbi:MAG TPA: DUF4290 domain-containing protein [Saprospiraceae bacterium]|nr:DUF4290 domain-containing protein [Saprospiraceae bacterium]HMQ84385.1 DUF4290 domain-containing protein [Saprospiraceae bacterium]
MSEHEVSAMEYNSSRELLVIPEFGRNVQKMIKFAMTIEDNQYRQKFIEKIINLMIQMHPQNRNVEDYREKLWKYVFLISDFKINVTPPGGAIPTPEDLTKKPDKINYPEIEAAFRHYGHNVQKLVKKAISMEPGPKRQGFVAVIASYMKLAYKTWNKEYYVSDDIIKTDLETLSKGLLSLDEHISIDQLGDSGSSHSNNNNNNNRRRSHSGSNNNNRRSSGGRDRDRDRDGYSGGNKSRSGGGGGRNGGGGNFRRKK